MKKESCMEQTSIFVGKLANHLSKQKITGSELAELLQDKNLESVWGKAYNSQGIQKVVKAAYDYHLSKNDDETAKNINTYIIKNDGSSYIS